jgi:hypothetical protein
MLDHRSTARFPDAGAPWTAAGGCWITFSHYPIFGISTQKALLDHLKSITLLSFSPNPIPVWWILWRRGHDVPSMQGHKSSWYGFLWPLRLGVGDFVSEVRLGKPAGK